MPKNINSKNIALEILANRKLLSQNEFTRNSCGFFALVQ